MSSRDRGFDWQPPASLRRPNFRRSSGDIDLSQIGFFFWRAVPLVAVLVALVWFVEYNWVQLPRTAAILLPLGLGLFVAIDLDLRGRWYRRLAWAVGGVLLAVLAYWFAPTSRGLSLWEARSQVAALADAPPGDVAGYLHRRGECDEVARQYPHLRKQVRAIHERWVPQSVRRAVSGTIRVREADPEAALARLRKAEADLEECQRLDPLDQRAFTEALETLRRGQQQALQAFHDKLDEELKERERANDVPGIITLAWKARHPLNWNPLRDAFHTRCSTALARAAVARAEAKLNDPEAALEGLREADRELEKLGKDQNFRKDELRRGRVKALEEILKRTQKRARDLEAGKKYRDLLTLGEQLRVRWAEDILDANYGQEMLNFRENCVARVVKGIEADIGTHLPADPARTLTEVRRWERELAQANVPALLLTWRSLRKRAIEVRLTQARKELADLVDADRYDAVGALGEQLLEVYGHEARAADNWPQLKAFVESCRYLAEVARTAGKGGKKE